MTNFLGDDQRPTGVGVDPYSDDLFSVKDERPPEPTGERVPAGTVYVTITKRNPSGTRLLKSLDQNGLPCGFFPTSSKDLSLRG